MDRFIRDGELILLGYFLRVHEHPGHTPGSASYSTEVIEDGVSYQVAIVNMASRNPGVSLIEKQPTRESIMTLRRRLKKTEDGRGYLGSAHAGFFKLHEKYQPGDSYESRRFMTPRYDEVIETFELL